MESPAGCMESVAKRRYGITRQRVFLLRIDYIQHFVLIPYRRQAADSIPQTSCGFHTADKLRIPYRRQTADSIHGFAVIIYRELR